MSRVREQSYLDRGLVLYNQQNSPLLVVPKELCTRCGACHVICPPDVIQFNDSEFPYINTEGCIDCGLCLKVCPGIDFNLPDSHQKVFGTDYQPSRIAGAFQKAYIGYSKLPGIREEGSAGGVVTHILIGLLRSGMIDGAVVVGSSLNDPTVPMPYIARTEEEIRAAAQSKYTVVANNKPLRELRQTRERFAFVGVGCQIHGLKKLQVLNKHLSQKAVLTIGLACRGQFEREGIRELLAVRRIDRQNVNQIFYRGGAFPGKFQAQLKNNLTCDLHRFEYIDGAYNTLFRLYLAQRCHLCPDYSAESADISCSDIFLRGKNGKYLYPHGSTLVLCRTGKGQQTIVTLMETGDLALEPLNPSTVEKTYSHHRRERKIIPFLRIAELRKQGKRSPNYGIENIQVSWSDRLYDKLYRLTFIFGKNPRVRRWVLRFLFSPLGEALIFVKIKYKKYLHMLKARVAQ